VTRSVQPYENAAQFTRFQRAEWSELRANTPLPLSPDDVAALRGLNEPMSIAEVTEVFLPLSRLVNLHVTAARRLLEVTDTFLGRASLVPPFVIGIAGSVSAGKSTVARTLQALLARWPEHPRVDLVTTDGFLMPNALLEARGLMQRKGFPESYDVARLLRFLSGVRACAPAVSAPVYSHLTYDRVPGEMIVVRQPDVLIVEGINVLQRPERPHDGTAPDRPRVIVSDFFDFSVYVDADEASLERWYVERFLTLRDTAFQHPESYFHRYRRLT
jgi:type I pantothenate kinase